MVVDEVLADTFQLRFRVKDCDEIAVVPKPVREKSAQTGRGTDDGKEGDDHGDNPVFQTDSDVESVAESAEASAEDCLDDEAVDEPTAQGIELCQCTACWMYHGQKPIGPPHEVFMEVATSSMVLMMRSAIGFRS